MPKKIKCLISIFLSLCVIFGLTITGAAIEPRYSYTKSVTVNLGFSGTTASCEVIIHGIDGTKGIDSVNIYLKDSKNNVKGKWLNLSSTGSHFTFSDSVSNLTKGETYTLSVSAKVNNKNGNSEDISESHTETCPSK